jgi:hypothetical protein
MPLAGKREFLLAVAGVGNGHVEKASGGYSVPGGSGQTLGLGLDAPPYDLSQADDRERDQQKEPDQEQGPRHIGHAVAKPVLEL